MNNGGEYGKVDFLSLSLKAPVDFRCRKHKFMGANRFLKKKKDYFRLLYHGYCNLQKTYFVH